MGCCPLQGRQGGHATALARAHADACPATGDFMLSFPDPVSAILFCLKARRRSPAARCSCPCLLWAAGTSARALPQVQSDMLAVLWSRKELALPGCQAQLADGKLLWCGPRVKMGVYSGVPVRVCPHATSGRCDVFGWVALPGLAALGLHKSAA